VTCNGRASRVSVSYEAPWPYHVYNKLEDRLHIGLPTSLGEEANKLMIDMACSCGRDIGRIIGLLGIIVTVLAGAGQFALPGNPVLIILTIAGIIYTIAVRSLYRPAQCPAPMPGRTPDRVMELIARARGLVLACRGQGRPCSGYIFVNGERMRYVVARNGLARLLLGYDIIFFSKRRMLVLGRRR
jgi:hypothetical protein